ncbi:phosphatidylserine lipase ABHD16A isoform X2 [Latimeria chalumnae]|uniref:phosphatidylserine lipase ABHD16A isoform X2 n=1 Tax=Latimeria chalumnae TaxID=7897 RepID=UPI00313EB16A
MGLLLWIRCVLGPKLNRLYPGGSGPGAGGITTTTTTTTTTATTAAAGGGINSNSSRTQGSYYQPKTLERHADTLLGWASVLWSISYNTSPLLLLYLYRKGYLCLSKLVPITQYVGTLLFLLAGVACLRGLGRWTNPDYVEFINVLLEAKNNSSPENKRKLACYNFDFKSWPVDFRWDEVSSRKDRGLSKAGVPLLKPEPRHRGVANSYLTVVKKLPCQVLSYAMAHSFGRRMLYPGSVYLLQKAMMPMLLQGQTRLIEECQGKRAKLVACDGNEIDTMFVDQRQNTRSEGKKLVICCEGNAGFYEVGCMSTPLEAGYSVLGWNHPGFCGSTGVPFPQNEANAMDVVVQYAIYRLGFQIENIIVYAWSIGGFTATWAAMTYPETSALVLDASFDDLVPLALKVMPESWRGLVTRTVREYMNLNNAEQLCKGPEDIMSNRGNDLLLRLLQFRYPNIMTEEGIRAVREWLSASNAIQEASVYSQYEVDDDWCTSVLQSYKSEHSEVFPWSVGEDMTSEGRRQLALFLARKYMRNFDATHCTPLPPQEFQLPWTL